MSVRVVVCFFLVVGNVLSLIPKVVTRAPSVARNCARRHQFLGLLCQTSGALQAGNTGCRHGKKEVASRSAKTLFLTWFVPLGYFANGRVG